LKKLDKSIGLIVGKVDLSTMKLGGVRAIHEGRKGNHDEVPKSKFSDQRQKPWLSPLLLWRMLTLIYYVYFNF